MYFFRCSGDTAPVEKAMIWTMISSVWIMLTVSPALFAIT